jgi:hypothetical protein
MSNIISQVDRVVAILKSKRNTPHTAKKIAQALYDTYPEIYKEKERLLLEKGGTNIVSQITAEVSSGKKRMKTKCKEIYWRDEPKKSQVYWFGDASGLDVKGDTDVEVPSDDNEAKVEPKKVKIKPSIDIEDNLDKKDVVDDNGDGGWDGDELSLYPIFNNYLYQQHGVYPLRIDEKRSKNTRGAGGNSWLHPDIVALDPIAKHWVSGVKDCANMSHGEIVNLWSFEVKKQLTTGNVRKHYFQAVSNSSWANYGYLVATSIATKEALAELKMLHALHGIGVIILNANDVDKTEIMLPAQKRDQVDWESVDRLARENRDFAEFVNNISDYLKTDRLKKRDWDDLDNA